MRILPTTQITLITALLLTACGGDKADYDFTKAQQAAATSTPPHGPVFDPATKKIPTTNDLLMDPKDGTINFPNPDNSPVRAALNELDGFSTTNPILADFGMPLDQASLQIGDSIHVFEVTKQGPAIASIIRELTAAEMVAAASGENGSTLALVPKVPLKESTGYMVILTNKIKGKDGKPAQASSAYTLARSNTSLTGGDFAALEDLRSLINRMEDVAASQDSVSKNEIVLSWSFTTQSISAVLNGVAAGAKAGKIVSQAIGKSTADINPALPGLANISVGVLDVPYYLEALNTTNPANPPRPLTGSWKAKGGASVTRYNPVPVATKTLSIPFMMTTPSEASNQAMPDNGWPIVMYQHGITRNRTDMLVYADGMAKAGFAVIAIDLPLHGVDTRNPLFPFFHTDMEPSFDLDVRNNETGAPGPDGKIDDSGKHFMNLQSLLTSRDNIRQGVSNLLVLRRSLKDIADIDEKRIGFIAHSLGGIVGVPYLAVEDKSLPTSLIAAGAPIRIILKTSDPFGVDVKNGLAVAGVTGADYEKFLYASQFVLDSADPINYAADAAANHPIHMIEMIGDKVVANVTTEALVGLMNAKTVTSTVADISKENPGIVRFSKGIHSTVLSPTHENTSFFNEFFEIHSQLAIFQATAGSIIKITDDTSIKK